MIQLIHCSIDLKLKNSNNLQNVYENKFKNRIFELD